MSWSVLRFPPEPKPRFSVTSETPAVRCRWCGDGIPLGDVRASSSLCVTCRGIRTKAPRQDRRPPREDP